MFLKEIESGHSKEKYNFTHTHITTENPTKTALLCSYPEEETKVKLTVGGNTWLIMALMKTSSKNQINYQIMVASFVLNVIINNFQ